ncbi:uncharacterized protein [Amphiura filiformis]|uniref:uncharacterized protein n=1 Tax=Amphiura filiformis TaxID=82378 RepID=UPI003B221274
MILRLTFTHAALLLGLLIQLSGDVETNPGPRPPKYPCGECSKACTDYKGAKASILCESCNAWYHADCVNIDAPMLSILGRSNIPWECCNCGLSNPSSNLFDSTILGSDISITSSRSSTSSCPPGSPLASSSPSKQQHPVASAANLRTLVINFQSIFAKREVFWSLLESTKPDVVMGCETWLKPGVAQGEIFPPGYSVYRKDRKDGYGGALLGITNSLNSHQVSIDADADIVAAKVRNGNNDIILGAVYRPTNNDQQYLDNLNQAIKDLCTSNPSAPVWIGGDMNLPDIDWDTEQIISHQYRKSINESYLLTLASVGLEQIVNFPTRGDNTLDLIATNRPSLVKQCVGMPGLSDHDVVFLEMSARAYRKKPPRRKILLWKQADLESIRTDAKAWSDDFVEKYTTSTPVETLATSIQEALGSLVDSHVPSKTSSSRYSQCWFDTTTKRMCRKKARAFKKARHTNKARDWRRYHNIKKQTQQTCRQTYNQYLSDIIDSDPDGNKKLGALVKSKRCDQMGVAPLKEGNILHCDPKQKANILNRQFSSVFTVDSDSSLPDLGPSPHPTMNDINVSCAGVTKLLQNLKPHKAAGPDGIPVRLLKETAEEISPAITMLFQATLNQGTIPSCWKKALVVPIFKKGSRSSAFNYRPISLTAVLSKLCEHIVHCSVLHHLIDQGILTDAQHGFRKRRSCDTQLLLTINDLARGLEQKQQIDLILLDFAKAFDKVSHQRLLLKAEFYGLRGHTLEWIKNFLQDRTQQVMIDGQRSSEAKVTSGVPQGSVLGPLLFLIYINDLPDSISSSTPRLFADDCVLYRQITSAQDCVSLQKDLDSLQEWERLWLMEFHPSKCQVVRITNKRKPIIGSYIIHNHTLEEVTSAKYLGVHIDSKLSFNTHVDTVVKKANSTNAFLCRNFRQCSRKIKKSTFTTYVRPIVEYAATAWDPHTRRNADKIEMVQRRGARFVTGIYDQTSSVTAMLKDLQWPTLESRRTQSRLAMMYRIRYNLVDINWRDHLTESSTRTRGHGSRFTLPHCSTQVYASSFFPRTCRDWNNLAFDPAHLASLNAFKTALLE